MVPYNVQSRPNLGVWFRPNHILHFEGGHCTIYNLFGHIHQASFFVGSIAWHQQGLVTISFKGYGSSNKVHFVVQIKVSYRRTSTLPLKTYCVKLLHPLRQNRFYF